MIYHIAQYRILADDLEEAKKAYFQMVDYVDTVVISFPGHTVLMDAS